MHQIDTGTPTWHALREALEARRAALTAECVAIQATDEERRACAARIDEIANVLAMGNPKTRPAVGAVASTY